MIILDYRDRRPLNEQVTEKLQALILKGALPPGSRMPSVRDLSMELSINPNTVQRAYVELERRGLIYPVRGRGNFVSEDAGIIERKKGEALEALRAALDACESAGISRAEALEAAREWGEEKHD